MSYYLLQDRYLLRGYRKLPFGITHPNLFGTDFFDKEQYAVILDCDGQTDIDEQTFTEKQKEIFNRLLSLNFIRKCEKGEKLKTEQEYVLYPSAYKNLVQWSITGRCNYLCKHCFLSAPNYHGEDLSIEKCTYILDQLCECGILSLGITGGEPLVHKDFYRLLEEIGKRKMSLESIYTNCALVNEKLLDKLESLDLKPAFNISFDGVGQHDWLRGVNGAETAVIKAVKLLKKRGFYVSVSMSLHRGNISSIRDTVRLLGELGCDHLKTNGMSYQGNWLSQKEYYISETEIFEYLLNYIPQYFEDGAPVSMQMGIVFDYDKKRRKMSIPAVIGMDDASEFGRPVCGVLKKGLYIGANGKVLPCMSFSGHPLEENFESVFDKPLKDIINGSYYTVCSNVTCGDCIEHNQECVGCEYRWICKSGCRAIACDNNKTDYYGRDGRTCAFYRGGYFDRAKKVFDEFAPIWMDDNRSDTDG